MVTRKEILRLRGLSGGERHLSPINAKRAIWVAHFRFRNQRGGTTLLATIATRPLR